MRCRRTARLGGLLFCLLLLPACAVTPAFHDGARLAERLPRWIEWDGAPFFPQEQYQCAPAALATVLNWTDAGVTPEALAPSLFVPGRKGSFQAEVIAAARAHGRVAYVIDPDVEALLTEVAAGNPVIVLQNLGLSWFPVWHYAVVVGFDLADAVVVLRSGRERRHPMSLGLFQRTWKRAGSWGLIVIEPARLPRTASERRYVEAVVGLEQVQRWREAGGAYRAALSRWPRSLPAWLGLGNSLYALGDKLAAEQAFRDAVAVHADAGVAHNNLALVLADLGRMEEALASAHRAVALGGPLAATFARTLAEIEQRARARAAAKPQ